MKYTDEVMISMLTNKSPKEFSKVVEYIQQQLTPKLYHYILRNGGKDIHMEEVLLYAIFEAHRYALKGKFKKKSTILAFINQVARNKFSHIIKKEKKIPIITIDDISYDLKDISKDENANDEQDIKIKAILKAIEKSKPEEQSFLKDVFFFGMNMEDLAQKYNLKNAQNARNKKCRIIKKIKKLVKELYYNDE